MAEFVGVTMLQSPSDLSWSGSLRSFLNQVDCRNVVLLLEDFFLCANVSTVDMLEKLATLKRLRANVIGLVLNEVDKGSTNDYYYYSDYRKYYSNPENLS